MRLKGLQVEGPRLVGRPAVDLNPDTRFAGMTRLRRSPRKHEINFP
jgi:hypothetical protein